MGRDQKGLESLGMRARLEVIGGSNLYHFDQGHPSLPCDQAYGDLLLSILGNEIGRLFTFMEPLEHHDTT